MIAASASVTMTSLKTVSQNGGSCGIPVSACDMVLSDLNGYRCERDHEWRHENEEAETPFGFLLFEIALPARHGSGLIGAEGAIPPIDGHAVVHFGIAMVALMLGDHAI